MKKISKFSLIIAGLALLFASVSCANGSSDDSPSNGGAEPVTPAPSGETSKNASYSKKVTIDLKDSPLSSTTVSSLSAGADITQYFTQNTMVSSRAAVTDDKGLTNFKVTLVKITATELVVEFSAKTASYDCSVYVSLVIPAELTEKQVAVTKLVTKVEVGQGVTDADDASAATLSIPTAKELAGKVFLDDINEKRNETYYYVFSDDGLTAVTAGYNTSTGKKLTSDEFYSNTYTYTEETGLLKVNNNDNCYYVKKANGSYFLTRPEQKFTRSSGSGLYSTFKYEKNVEEKDRITKASSTITFKNDNTFSGSGNSYDYECDTYPKYIENQSVNVKSEHIRLKTNTMSGVFANNDGILTLKSKNAWKYTKTTKETIESGEPDTNTETYNYIYDYENDLFLYDGTNLIYAKSTTSLPEVKE